jgi:hypothetical protein
MVWIGSIWLRIVTSGWFLWTRKWTFGFHKTLGSSWVSAQLAASQEWHSSMSEWVSEGQGGPVIHPCTGMPFHRLLRLAGLRWRYSTPPPLAYIVYQRCDMIIYSWKRFFYCHDIFPLFELRYYTSIERRNFSVLSLRLFVSTVLASALLVW